MITSRGHKEMLRFLEKTHITVTQFSILTIAWRLPEYVTPKGPERHHLEVQFLSEHGHHARYLLLLTVARVIGPGLKVGCHHVIDSGENLHDF